MTNPIRIIGVPIDLGAQHRGTDMGPSALRVAGVAAGLRKLGLEVGREQDVQVPSMESRVADDSNLRFKNEIHHVCERLCKRVQRALDEGAFPLMYGGDHSLAMGSVAGAAAHFRAQGQNLGLIWFDAHADMNSPASSPSGNIHGMPLAVLLGQGDPSLCAIGGDGPKVDPKNVALVGIREVDLGERAAIKAAGINVWTMRDIDELGMHVVITRALEVVCADTAGFHLSFDVDGLDPEIAPGTGTRVPGGVDFREAHLFMETIADSGKMCSADIVELNPILDHGNQTAELVKELILSAFGKAIL